ncbi:MAG: hypothetical protein C4297_06180 [Gemmataceae bacterium]
MLRRIAKGLVWTSLLALFSCAELERRREPDLLHLRRSEVARLSRPARLANYVPQVTAKNSWRIHSSLAPVAALADGDPSSSAGSAGPCQPSQWILVDLGDDCLFQQVIQWHPAESWPPRFRIDVADQRGFPYELVYLGTGTADCTTAILAHPVRARFVRITTLEAAPRPWGVSELEIR